MSSDDEELRPDEFIVGEIAESGLIAFFEQDEATGYLYLAEPDYKIRYHLHIYNRSKLTVTEDQVRVLWNSDQSRCGVYVAGKLRGVIGANGDRYRPPMISLDSQPVLDPQ